MIGKILFMCVGMGLFVAGIVELRNRRFLDRFFSVLSIIIGLFIIFHLLTNR